MNRIEQCKLEGAAAGLAKEYADRANELRTFVRTTLITDVAGHAEFSKEVAKRTGDLQKIHAAWIEVTSQLKPSKIINGHDVEALTHA